MRINENMPVKSVCGGTGDANDLNSIITEITKYGEDNI